MSKKGDLRVWWIPQVPGRSFHVLVRSLQEARLVNDTLARYDDFQYREHIKPDFCNAGGLEEFDGDEWVDWYSEDEDSFDEWLEKQV